jgi:hypothetical protein
MKRGNYGSGSIEQRGPDRFRLTHYVGGKRHREWVNGTRSDANRRLRELTARADAGEHVPKSRITLEAWVAEWLTLLARGESSGMRRKGRVTPRTRERYQELVTSYVLPTLGSCPIQKLTPTQIDHVYIGLEQRLSSATVRHVHTALKACLATAQCARVSWSTTPLGEPTHPARWTPRSVVRSPSKRSPGCSPASPARSITRSSPPQ